MNLPYPEASDEDALKALEHMDDVATRIEQGVITFTEGQNELIAAGADPHRVLDFLLKTTDPKLRKFTR